MLAAVLVPGRTLAESNAVPPIDGQWEGTLTSVYWDQTSAGSVRPKKKFKSNVDVDISQDPVHGDLTMVITFDPNNLFPASSAASVSQLTLDGAGGNYHLNAATGAGPSVALSGSSDKNGSRLKLNGVSASTDITHELKLSLKRVVTK